MLKFFNPWRSLAMLLTCFLFTTGAYAGGDVDAGAKKAAVCTGCHGPQGKSAVAIFPKLAGQHAEYLEYALNTYKNKERTGKYAVQMYSMAAGLSDEDIADLAAYYAAQE